MSGTVRSTSADGREIGWHPDGGEVLTIAISRNPESGLHKAQLSWPHPTIVTAYGLAEVFKAIWDRLLADNSLARFASAIAVDSTYRDLREDNDRLKAQLTAFSVALSRLADPDHPAGSPANVDQARELAELAFARVRQVERERREAWRNGALAKSNDDIDREALGALFGSLNDLLALLEPGTVLPAADGDPAQAMLGRVRAVLAARTAGA